MESLMKMFSLAGKTAVVTGGTRGIGAAMAIALAEAGADIILIQVGASPVAVKTAY
jgi:2-dehydro-3-deoxy-D-gluconate 5-dehydrogenase